MIHKDLRHQLDGLKELGVDESHPEYIKLETYLEELSKYPKGQWNDLPREVLLPKTI